MIKPKAAYNLRVTSRLTFDQALKVGSIETYRSQVESWILSPAHTLANQQPNNTDHGMALLAMQLMFFEPHGAYLLGLEGMKNLRGNLETTGTHFKFGFKSFLSWYFGESENVELAPDADSIYKWMRCGLFHTSHLPSSIMIGVGPTSKVFFKHPKMPEVWLVSPWMMLPELKRYFENYIARLQSSEQPLLENFDKAYQFFFADPMRIIESRMK